MAKAAVPHTSFNSGELSPLLYGSYQNPRYKKGLTTCLNYLPTLQGPLVRRPGLVYMTNVKDSTKPPILIPFQFAITQAYILEFGDGYIRFFANNGQLVTVGSSFKVSGTAFNATAIPFFATRANLNPHAGETIVASSAVSPGAILEIQSPYRQQDLALLRFTQNSDTLYLVHPNYPPYKLQRFGQTFWTLTQIYFQDGPYLALNSYQTTGDSVGISLTTLDAGNTSRVQTGTAIAVAGAASGTGGQIEITATAHGFANGQNVFISGVAGTTEANNYNPSQTVGSGAQYPTHPAFWPIVVTSDNSFILVGSVFANAYGGGGTAYPALFGASVEAMRLGNPVPDLGRLLSLTLAGNRYWGYIGGSIAADPNTPIGFSNASTAQLILGPTGPLKGNQGSVGAALFDAWRLGVWGGNGPTAQNPSVTFAGQGYPSCLCFHQNRLVFAGALNQPQEVDASNTGSYEIFSPSAQTAPGNVTDNNSYQFSLASNDANVLKWLSSTAQGLLAGSFAAEWSMTPAGSSEALTPTNFNAQQTSSYGSAAAASVQIGNATLYIQRAQRKIREMNFFFQVGTFRSTDLTELSEHISLPSVIQLAVQKETQPIIWGVRSDGTLVSMVYNRDDLSLFAGWARHILGGRSDSGGAQPMVTSIAVIPDPLITFDQLWAVVKRFVNGSVVYTIEYMSKIFDDATLQEDAVQLDGGATFYNPKTITGISVGATTVVTAPAHGFSNGFQIKITGVNGLNKSTTDANGNVTVSNLVNEKTFTVGNVAANTFQLFDFTQPTPVAIDSTGYSAYISGGAAAKLVTTISGLSWLIGETVSLLTDGGVHPDVVVSNAGQIVLNYPAAKVQIGYAYKSQGRLMRPEAGAPDGTSIGKTRRVHRVAFMLHRTGSLLSGTDFKRLLPLELGLADESQADNEIEMFEGIYRDGVESAYDFEGQICFEQADPLPGCVQAITIFMEEFDV